MEDLSQWLATNAWAMHLIAFIILWSGLLIAIRTGRDLYHRRKVRRLSEKYPDPADVQRILNRIPWEGETTEQLQLSFGNLGRFADESQTGRSVSHLKIPRTKGEDYLIALQEDRVTGWQLYKS